MHSSILWNCIIDDVDDDILLEIIGATSATRETLSGESTVPPSHSYATTSRACRIIRLRRDVLRQLQHNVIQLNNEKLPVKNDYDLLDCNRDIPHFSALSVLGFSRVFSMAMSLTAYLNRVSNVSIS